jgi:hypothetical protein
MRPLTRIAPVGPAAAYKTYAITVPTATHTMPASCSQVDCPQYLNGWKTILDKSQESLIRMVRCSGRSFKENVEGTIHTFVFEPGQPCFKAAEHRIQIRPEIYSVRGGDFRGNPLQTPTRIHKRPSDWVEDFSENVEKLTEQQKRGN